METSKSDILMQNYCKSSEKPSALQGSEVQKAASTSQQQAVPQSLLLSNISSKIVQLFCSVFLQDTIFTYTVGQNWFDQQRQTNLFFKQRKTCIHCTCFDLFCWLLSGFSFICRNALEVPNGCRNSDCVTRFVNSHFTFIMTILS